MSAPRPLFALSLLLVGCSTGGEEDRNVSEIKIDASHNMFALGGDRAILKFPIPRDAASTDLGVFTMNSASQYTVSRTDSNNNTQTSSAQNYSLGSSGELFLVVPILRSSPTRFVGAYREGDPKSTPPMAGGYFFTDRYAPNSAPRVGMFWGTLVDDPDPAKNKGNPVGEWHVFAQHVLFSKSTIPAEDEVGRSFFGEITVAANGAITGSGEESSGDNIGPMAGTATGDEGRRIMLDKLDFRRGSKSDRRDFICGQSEDLILGVDAADTGVAAGLIALVKKFDPLTLGTIVDEDDAKKALAGTYNFGMHTIFVKVNASGIDAANGTIEFTDVGGWTLNGVGSKGPSAGRFTYAGTYKFVKDPTNGAKLTNRLELSVKGPPKETWHAAVDLAFGILVIVDNDKEDRRPSLESTELNLVLATRRPEK